MAKFCPEWVFSSSVASVAGGFLSGNAPITVFANQFSNTLNVHYNEIKSEVLDYMDHKNLNLDVTEFKNLNPTAENIAIVIYNRIDAKLPDNLNLKIRLYETQRNIVEYPA